MGSLNHTQSDTERRTFSRYPVWFPVQIDAGPLGTAVGVTKDASAKGLLIHANAKLIIGAPVRLTFRVAPHESPQQVDATIVRGDSNECNGCDWPYRLALEFDDPDASMDARLQEELRAQGPQLLVAS